MKGTTAALVAAYLAAIVAANLSSAHFGPEASIYNAFLLIGLTLTVRDRLHDAWRGRRLRNMALLIAGGSALSYLASLGLADEALPADVVGRIALASCAAFASSETLDALLYHRLRRRPWLERANTSNLLSAAVDSAVFVSVAFGWSWAIVFGQACAKVAGGFVYSLVLRARGREPVGAEA
jgi:uncharacterized PurR-regulated membrane protein YhhQ (DUF165 family)